MRVAGNSATVNVQQDEALYKSPHQPLRNMEADTRVSVAPRLILRALSVSFVIALVLSTSFFNSFDKKPSLL